MISYRHLIKTCVLPWAWYCHRNLIEGAREIFITYTLEHISMLRVLGNSDSAWKTHSLLNKLDRIWMKIFKFLTCNSSSTECVCHVESQFPSTLSREICTDVCYTAFCDTLSLREECLCLCLFIRNLEKYE